MRNPVPFTGILDAFHANARDLQTFGVGEAQDPTGRLHVGFILNEQTVVLTPDEAEQIAHELLGCAAQIRITLRARGRKASHL